MDSSLGTYARYVLGIGALMFILGALYSYSLGNHGGDGKAAAAVKQTLTARGLSADLISCSKQSLAASSVPALAPVARLHPGQSTTLYNCTVRLTANVAAQQVGPDADREFCVVGFSGSAPWDAVDSDYSACQWLTTQHVAPGS